MTYARNSFHSDHIVEMVLYLNFVPNLNLRSCVEAGSSEQKDV